MMSILLTISTVLVLLYFLICKLGGLSVGNSIILLFILFLAGWFGAYWLIAPEDKYIQIKNLMEHVGHGMISMAAALETVIKNIERGIIYSFISVLSGFILFCYLKKMISSKKH